jgi:putative Holliday junction resolvase
MPDSAEPITVLAFDFGLKQIGVAYGQTLTNSARGLSILSARDGVPQWAAVQSLLTEWQPQLLLVGLPINMDDSESELSIRALKFARRLQGRFNVEVQMVDERLSSQAAKSLVREENKHSRGRKQDLTKIDHIAAAMILQSWLDDPTVGLTPQ